jgi:hypothetical protein
MSSTGEIPRGRPVKRAPLIWTGLAGSISSAWLEEQAEKGRIERMSRAIQPVLPFFKGTSSPAQGNQSPFLPILLIPKGEIQREASDPSGGGSIFILIFSARKPGFHFGAFV